jgi:hypothetical protein
MNDVFTPQKYAKRTAKNKTKKIIKNETKRLQGMKQKDCEKWNKIAKNVTKNSEK